MKRFIVGFIPLSFMVGLPAIAGRMACVLVAALLACASSAHGQVIEEGGFPVKGGGVSGEAFSLSCPPRLVAQAGESVLLSCSATAVPEEGVRYEWESLSGDGLHLLSDANERSPLFTAPVSGEGVEYVYRLTAMSVGVYETATVTVVARGVSGGSVQGGGKLPVAQEDCDSFGALEGFREGCVAGDKTPPSFEPFGGGPEGEGGPGLLFPEAPVLPDRPSGPVRGGGPGRQAPPRLECPVAVFLEELETGQIECHAWDASGEEFLEYSWEPVGSTTRDYLNNPRLIPEDAPNPSVVAPEAPVYETLESFHSGETTFRYRYRLTATSRATGLSSSSEVGVYVSSSRPSVYCPLEIVVEEGSTATLDCEGVDPLSHRMDYDEDGASIEWEWEGLWGTSTAHLDETDLSSPLFTAPVGSAGEEYHYIASMTSSASGAPRTARRRVTVRVTEAEEGEQAAGDASALAYKGAVPVVTCNDSEVYEATADFTLDCSVTDEPTGATYAWTARGSTANTDDLSSTTILKPTFDVPDNIDADTDYDYTVTLSAAGIDNVTADVTVTVLEKPDISCSQAVWNLFQVYEGTPDALLANGCVPGWRGAPGANPVYTFAWTARGSTTDTHLISATNIETPTFYVPDMVESDEIYEYTLTVSAENADDFTLKVTVTVRGVLAPVITCNNPDPVYEGSADIVLDCSVTYEPSGATYNWGVYELNRLSSTTILKPTFSVPDDVPANFSSYRYRYAVTLSVAGADVSSGYITVTVLNKPDITVTCEDSPYDVDEGDAYFDFDCSASGAPGDDPDYTWSWSPTTNLTNHDTATPTFAVPASVDQHTTYTYTVTASADNAEDGTAEVTVTVTVKDLVPVITCNDAEAYEDTADFTLDCSVTDEPTGATYAWTARGSTANTNDLSSTTILKPTFDVPDNVDADTDYEYTVTLSAGGADVASADITVTVLEKPDIYCPGSALIGIGLFEGSSDFPLLICPDGWRTVLASSDYVYAWTAQGSTTSTDRLSATNIEVPTFALPDAVDKEETYEYTLTVSAENADDALARVEVTVWDRPDITVTCENSPYEVDEGDTDTELECDASGEPDGSTYTWSWSPTTNLTDHNTATPMFAVPDDVDQDTTYTYTVTASSDNADDGTAEVTVTVRDTDSADPSLTCTDSEVYEGASDITLDCSVTNEPSGATYAWTARGSTSGTGELSSTTILKPTFDVPDDIDETGGADKDYEYTITMSASGIDDVTEDVTVTVLEKPDITCRIESYNGPGSITYYQEGNGTFRLPTCPENDLLPARIPRSNFIYSWTGTSDIDLLSATNVHSPTFSIPENLPSSKEYSYRLQVSAPGENADPRNRVFQIRISDRPDITVTCEDSPYEVDEGDDDFELECEADGVPGLPDYTWSWSPTDGLTNHNTATPTFDVPDNVDQDTTWTYTVTVTEDDGDDGTATVTVTVRDTDSTDPSLTCTDSEVYEGASDITLDCSVTNEPSGATYAWTARGSTSDTDDLSSNTILAPMFDVPDDIDEPNGADKDYDYTVTLSAGGADVASADITVTVLEKPDIYCPGIRQTRLALFEGISDFPLDICYEGWEGAPGANPVYAYAWTARGSTPDTRRLSATNIETPIFDVPDPVESTETYRYTLTVSAANADDASVPINVLVVDRDSTDPSLTCTDSEVYEGAADITLDCSVTDEPTGATYAWTARGSTSGTSLLSSTTILKPTFDVPDNVDADTDYDYTVTLSASGIDDVTEDVTVRVLNKPSLTLVCAPIAPVYEGAADFDLDCVASGDPSGSDNYTYVWTARGATSNTDLLIAGTDGPTPTFDVPEEVASDETYEYTLTVSADNAEDASANVTVRVLNKPSLTLICTPVAPVYEGAEDFDLDCSASGAPTGSEPVYVWTARGATSNTDLLIAGTDGPTPTFDVPEEVASDETYEYTLTVSADNAEDASANVTVRVLNKPSLTLICTPVAPVYEGAEDFDLDCSASGAPTGSEPVYVWTARGATSNTDNLSSTTVEKPTFDVPEEVDSDETYEYTLTVSADNAESATEEVTVTVLNKKALEVACATPSPVYEESEDFALDCAATGAPAGSEYAYVWTGRGSTTNTDLLVSGTDGPTPTFDVPEQVDEDETYEYLLTVSAENAEDGAAEVTVKVLNFGSIALICASPPPVYEGSEDFELDCSIFGDTGDTDYTYEWTARGATPNTDELSATNIPSPTFYVPDALDRATTYEYLLTARAANVEDATAEVTVTILNRGTLAVACAPPPLVYEGADDFALDCTASGAPVGSDYEYVWTARGSTSNTDLLIAGTDGPTPTFNVPDALDETTTYEYLLTASAENAESSSARVTVTVLNRGALSVVCVDPPSVYEGSEDFDLDCSASGAPSGSAYEYAWTARGSTPNTDLLTSGTDGPTPTFDVPDALDETTTYEYLLTASAENAESGSAEVTVTVLNAGALRVVCADPPSVYEGSADLALDCSASGAPAGSEYAYVWTARGTTANTDELSAVDISSPTFYVPEEVDETTTYEYLLTASAENAEDATAEVTVTVLNRGALSVVCLDTGSVYEGSEDITLDCSASGAPAGSDYAYVWTAQGDTENTLQLSATDISSPTFYVPDEVDETTTYEYLLTASAENMEDGAAEVTVTVLNRSALSVVCADPGSVYEGSEDITLDCTASGAPSGSAYEYAWTARESTANTDELSAVDISSPTFYVPDEVDETTTYEYLLTVSAENAEDGAAEVTVTVLNRGGALSVVCMNPGSEYEGSEDITLDCTASGAPEGSEYAYVWTAQGDTENTLQLSATDIPSPTFYVPDAVDVTTDYEYLLTASAENAESGSAEVTVTVLNAGALRVVCADPPSVYEGSADLALDCSASGAPAGSEYAYVWTARGTTANTDELSAVDISSPTFYVPEEVDETTTYEYLLTASAENAEDATAEVTVTVLNRGALSVVCLDPGSVYEGSEDITLDCSASGAPAGSEYAYVWTARGTTANTDELSAVDISSPTFYVPEEVDETTTYEYLLTASAENAEDATAEVTVTVLNRGALSVVCLDTGSVYEGSEDITLDCSASGAPAGSDYAYVWTAQGDTENTLQLSATDISSPTFYVPDEVDETTTYEYLLTASAENMEDGAAEVTVTVLNRSALSVVCADPGSVYEGSEDITLDCTASGAPSGSAYEYAWTARESTANTDELSAVDISSPTFYVPDEVDETTTYEYLLTVSAENAEDGAAEVTVTVLNRGGALSVVCMNPGSEYEGSEDITLDCTASGAPEGSEYAYVWTAQGDTENTLQLSATDIPSPTFYVPDAVDVTTDYEYLLTASAENAEDASAEVVVTVLNRGPLSVVCTDPGSVYEGSEDFAFDCTASGAPPGPEYTYVWTARDSTANTDLLSRVDISSPTFYVPDAVDTTTTYKYLLTASAENAEDASAEVMVTVLDGAPLVLDDAIAGRVYIFTVGEVIEDVLLPEATGGLSPYTYTLEPVLPRGLRLKVDGDTTRTISGTPLEVSPRSEYTWQVTDANAETAQIAFFIEVVPAADTTSVPIAESSSELPEPSALGVTVSASSLRFGVQSAQTQVSLDPMTDGISTRVSGPYHAGRMTLALDGSGEVDENGEMDLSIELASPVVLRREGGIEATSIILAPQWSLAESCEQLSSQAIGGLYTEVTLSDADCRLLLFGGELDLTDILSGQYTGSLDIILRSGESEETHTVDVEVTVVPAQRVITIGPGGVRFSTSREIPVGLTEEQNLSIYPHIAFLTEEQPNGMFELSNPSLIPLEVSVSARFGYTEATENGREVVVEDASGSHLGDLSQVVDIHPGVLVLQPGEKGLVRYGLQEGALAAMAEKGYAAFFDVVSEPRQYVRTDQMPEEVTGDRTARVTMRVPGVYAPGEGASQLRATLLSISFVGPMSATFLLETQDHPFAGEVVAYDGDGRELGRRETLVYTRSRVRIPLDRMPEEGTVFLRFSPRGSGRVPEPASVEWYAPRRDIGNAEDEDRTSLPATLVQKP